MNVESLLEMDLISSIIEEQNRFKGYIKVDVKTHSSENYVDRSVGFFRERNFDAADEAKRNKIFLLYLSNCWFREMK